MLFKLVGELHAVKTLRDGNLIVCRDKDQQVGLMRCTTQMGKNIKLRYGKKEGDLLVLYLVYQLI